MTPLQWLDFLFDYVNPVLFGLMIVGGIAACIHQVWLDKRAERRHRHD
jgi:hypothetical protein